MPDYMQQAFNGGELSPQVLGQIDFNKYKTGLANVTNWACLPHGPVQVRSGTEYIAEVKDSSKEVRLVPFVASVDAAYVLEVGDEYVRFYNNGARIDTQEFIVNGNMNEDRYWRETSTTLVTTNERSEEQAYSGGYSRKVVATAVGNGIYSSYYEVPLVDGTELDFSMWIYSNVTSVRVVIDYWDTVATTTVSVHDASHSISSGQWDQVTFTETLSLSNASHSLTARIYTTAADPSATFYVDSVSMVGDSPCEAYSYGLTESRLFEIDYAQSIDEMYIVHPDFFPTELVRYGNNAWFFQDATMFFYATSNSFSWTISGSGTNEYYLRAYDSAGTLVDPLVNAPTKIAGLTEGVLGSLSYLQWGYGDNDSLGFNTLYMRINADPSTRLADSYAIHYYPMDWLGYFNAGGDITGQISSVCFNDGRLMFAGGERFYASQSNIYNDFSQNADTVLDSDGLSFILGDGQFSEIFYIRPLRGLTALAASSEWMITGQNDSSIITANSNMAQVGSRSGSDKVRPLLIDNSIVHVLRHKKSIKELVYDFASDKYQGNELTILAEHLLRNYPIKELAYQRAPYKIIWACRTDGTLLGLTYFPEHKVYGWHKHEIGGNGEVESICVIPGDGVDELWMVVKRTINSTTKRYIERLNPFFIKPDQTQDYFMDDDTTDAIVMDSSITTDNRIDISGITSADPAVLTTSSNHGWSNGNTIRIRNVVGLVDGDGESGVNGLDFTVANVTADTAELQYGGTDFDSTSLTAYSSGGTAAKKVTSITGLSHLEGETVTILGDGEQITSETVSGGAITLDSAASVVQVGLGYNADIQSLSPRMESKTLGYLGSHQKQINAIMLQLFESTGLSYGTDEDNLVSISWDGSATPTGVPRLYDGDTDELSFKDTYKRDPSVYIRQASPLPATISALHMDIEVS